uniref:Uncharacterized protein n=1 Tax=Salix viminalis TaxID=40686 RepID=A0A6N2MBW3_SALVM
MEIPRSKSQTLCLREQNSPTYGYDTCATSNTTFLASISRKASNIVSGLLWFGRYSSDRRAKDAKFQLCSNIDRCEEIGNCLVCNFLI